MTERTYPDLLVIRVDPVGEEAASVTLASDQAEVTAFCHPCALVAGQRIPNRLTVLDTRLLQPPHGDDWPEDEREALGQDRLIRKGHFEYAGTGEVIDANRGLVAVCGFVIDFGDLPPVRHVEFDILRLDCDGGDVAL